MSSPSRSLTTLDLTHALETAPTSRPTKPKDVPDPERPTGKRKLDQVASISEPALGETHSDLRLALPTSNTPAQFQRSRKTYKYLVDDLKRIRNVQYQFLHSVVDFLKEQKYPSDVTTATQRQNFKRRLTHFTLVDDVLYRKKGTELLRVLWEDEVQPALLEIHEKGAQYPKDQGKFRQLVESVFHFPQLAVVTRAFLLSCDVCQKEKAGRAGRTDREIYPTPPVDPFFRVHVDLLGPVQRSRTQKFKYVMLVIDPVSKHLSGRGLRDNKAATVAEAFREESLLRHGCPFQIVTDRGTEFNKEFAEQLRKEGLNHVLIRTRNPKANGQVERLMSVVKSQLRILCDAEPTTCEDHVSRIVFQYNISHQESIKTSPFVALYGRKPIIPAHHLFGAAQPTPLDHEIEPTLDDQISRFETIRNVQQQVKIQIEEAQTKAKENYARWNAKKRKRIDNLQKGDFALMQKPGTIRGFRLHWEGPYKFKGWTGQGDNRVAVLQDAQGRKWKRRGVEVVKYYSRDQFAAEFLSLSSRFPTRSHTPQPRIDAPTSHDFDLNQLPIDTNPQTDPLSLTYATDDQQFTDLPDFAPIPGPTNRDPSETTEPTPTNPTATDVTVPNATADPAADVIARDAVHKSVADVIAPNNTNPPAADNTVPDATANPAADVIDPDAAAAFVTDDTDSRPAPAKQPRLTTEQTTPTRSPSKKPDSTSPASTHAPTKETIYLDGLVDPNPVHGTVFAKGPRGLAVRRSLRARPSHHRSLRIYTHYKLTRKGFASNSAVSRKRRSG